MSSSDSLLSLSSLMFEFNESILDCSSQITDSLHVLAHSQHSGYVAHDVGRHVVEIQTDLALRSSSSWSLPALSSARLFSYCYLVGNLEFDSPPQFYDHSCSSIQRVADFCFSFNIVFFVSPALVSQLPPVFHLKWKMFVIKLYYLGEIS